MDKIYYLDKRSVALFRITLGLLLIYNFIVYKLIPAKDFLLPESGLIGNEYKQVFISQQLWSPIDFITTDVRFYILCSITLLVYVLFTIGYFTRWMTVLSWLLFFSFQQRYYPLEMGWDKYIQAMLFVSMLLPLNHFFSVDKKLSGKEIFNNQYEFRHPFALVVLVQIGAIYFFSGIVKNGELWLSGDAVRIAVNDYLQHTSLTPLLLQSDFLMKFLNYYTMVFESILILLLFFPYKNKNLRYVAIFIILSFHWGISIFMHVGHFKWVAIVACAILLPDSFWEMLYKRIPKWKNTHSPKSIQPGPATGISYYAAILITVFLISFIFHNGWRKLSLRGGMVSEYMKEKGLNNVLENTVFYPSKYFLSSYFNQSWFFYAPNPPEFSGAYFLSGKLNGNEYSINGIESPARIKTAKNIYRSELDMFFQEKLSLFSLQLNDYEQTTKMYQELNRMWMMDQYKKWSAKNQTIQLDGVELWYIYYKRSEKLYFDDKKWNEHLVESIAFEW